MKILLLNPPFHQIVIRDNYCSFTSKSNYLWPPIDLLILSGLLKNDFNVSVIDAIAENLSPNLTFKKIINLSPDVIIFLTGTASYEKDFQFINELAKKITTRFIALGNIVAFNPHKILSKQLVLEAIIQNFTSQEIVDYLKAKKRKKYFHLSYRQGKKIILGNINSPNSDRLIKSLNLPVPIHHFFPLHKYFTPIMKQKPLTSVLTSFGCPFNCKYCVASTLNYLPRSIDSLKKEFKYLKKINVRELFFEDSTFNANPKFTLKICQLLIDGKYNFSWSANIHSALLTKKMAIAMKKAGCHTVNIGIENASDQILRANHKATNTSRISECLKICQQIGLNVLGYFIIGLPEDNKDTITKTINYACDLDPTIASFSIATADYGTRLRTELANQNQIIDSPKFDSSLATNYRHQFLTQAKLNQLLLLAYLKFYLRPKKIWQIIALSIQNRTIIPNLFGSMSLLTKQISNFILK